MKVFLSAALVIVASSSLSVQEREIPKDSALVEISGCAKGRTFIVGPRSEHQPGSVEIAPGRRFRLSGSKTLLSEIKARERTMITVSGLVRKSQLAEPGGVSLAGGRVRIGGAQPRDPGRLNEPVYNEVVIDVESWRGLSESCPAR